MYCPSCGKEIPDKSQFCSHCGSPIVITPTPSNAHIEWEHIHFSWTWDRGKGGSYPLSSGRSEPLGRAQFWGDNQGRILPDLQRYLDKGWQPITEVGPNAFIFRKHSGNPDWLEVAAYRVKLRRQRTSPSPAYELNTIGKWQHVDTRGGGCLVRLFQGLSAATGGQVKEFEFARENLVTGYATNHSVSGVYTFTDEHHLSITADPPKAFSVNAELNGAYDTMIIHDVGGLQARYRKAQ